MIDTHAHLYLDAFEDDINEVVQRARDNGISKVLLPNIDEDSIFPMQKLFATDSSFFSMAVGIHPTSVKSSYQKQIAIIEQELISDNYPYCAVGEIGIDLYWDISLVNQQKEVFAQQCEIALQHKLPVIIHARESFDEIFDVLAGFKNRGLTGVFHCFTGTQKQARHALDMGFFLGIGGVSTYKNSGLDEVIRYVGISSLLLETDAPFLSPVPKRGKRNESSFLIYIAQKIAEIKELTLENVIYKTTDNVMDLFRLFKK